MNLVLVIFALIVLGLFAVGLAASGGYGRNPNRVVMPLDESGAATTNEDAEIEVSGSPR